MTKRKPQHPTKPNWENVARQKDDQLDITRKNFRELQARYDILKDDTRIRVNALQSEVSQLKGRNAELDALYQRKVHQCAELERHAEAKQPPLLPNGVVAIETIGVAVRVIDRLTTLLDSTGKRLATEMVRCEAYRDALKEGESNDSDA